LNKDIKIQALVADGNNQTEIAKILSKNKSVISVANPAVTDWQTINTKQKWLHNFIPT
jgi:saccharopine dehydrogenase-like NADP-dependent oxidoreductase